MVRCTGLSITHTELAAYRQQDSSPCRVIFNPAKHELDETQPAHPFRDCPRDLHPWGSVPPGRHRCTELAVRDDHDVR
jgi:hypothetical protein